MIYTRTTQQWQWLLGKLWHGAYRCRCPKNENPYLIAIETIDAKLGGNTTPSNKPISVNLSASIIEEMREEYVEHIRNSGLLGRQPQHGHVPELLDDLPRTHDDDHRGSEALPELREHQRGRSSRPEDV